MPKCKLPKEILSEPLMRKCPVCKRYYPAKRWKRKADACSGFEYDESPCGHGVWTEEADKLMS